MKTKWPYAPGQRFRDLWNAFDDTRAEVRAHVYLGSPHVFVVFAESDDSAARPIALHTGAYLPQIADRLHVPLTGCVFLRAHLPSELHGEVDPTWERARLTGDAHALHLPWAGDVELAISDSPAWGRVPLPVARELQAAGCPMTRLKDVRTAFRRAGDPRTIRVRVDEYDGLAYYTAAGVFTSGDLACVQDAEISLLMANDPLVDFLEGRRV